MIFMKERDDLGAVGNKNYIFSVAFVWFMIGIVIGVISSLIFNTIG